MPTDFMTALIVACLTSSALWMVITTLGEKRLRLAQVNMARAQQNYENKLNHTEHQLFQAQVALEHIRSRCGDTFTNYDGVHHCTRDVGHLSTHSDDLVEWWGSLEWPQEVENVELARVSS